jgi:hypothetical protein
VSQLDYLPRLNLIEDENLHDYRHISALLQIASAAPCLAFTQYLASQKLFDFARIVFPKSGCAIMLSLLLREAGISVTDIYQAIGLGKALKADRKWSVIPVGEQRSGDIGLTCGEQPNHGADHIYLVLSVLSSDKMVIVDNQALMPHFRFASGKGGTTPTRRFLRAPERGSGKTHPT